MNPKLPHRPRSSEGLALFRGCRETRDTGSSVLATQTLGFWGAGRPPEVTSSTPSPVRSGILQTWEPRSPNYEAFIEQETLPSETERHSSWLPMSQQQHHALRSEVPHLPCLSRPILMLLVGVGYRVPLSTPFMT